jgi:hypothetical protein
MDMVLAANRVNICSYGRTKYALRQCPKSMSNNIRTDRGHECYDVGIPRSYLSECLDLLNNTWHANRRQFTIKQAQQMVGKLARLGEGANWVHHLLSHVYTSIAAALTKI